MPVKLVHNLNTPPLECCSYDFDNMAFDDNLKATKKILSKMEDEASKMRKKIIEVEKMKVRKLLGGRSLLNSDDEYCSGSSTGGAEDFDAGLALRYKGMLKEQLSLQAHELKNYRDKVLKLQDQLIQKNENEKRMLRKHHKPIVVQSSCDLEKQLEAKVAKVRSLEEAYRKQEKVIEKMEMLLRMQSISKAKRTEKRMEELEKENALLRKRLIEMKDECCSPCPCSLPRQSPQHTLDGSSQPPHPPHRHHHHHHHHQSSRKQHQQGKPLPVDSFQDYLEMKEKFHQAEAKIKRLENQITENQEEWTSEKTKLMNLLKSNKEGDGFCLCSRKKFVRPPRHFHKEYEEPLRSFDSEDNSSIHHHHQQDHHHIQHPKDHHTHQLEERHHLHQDHLHDYLQQQQPHDYHRPRDHHQTHHLRRRRHHQLQKLQQFQKCSYPCCEPISSPSSTTFTRNNSNELQGHVRQQQPFLSPPRFEQH